MSLYGVPQPDDNSIGMKTESEETLKTWTPGKRLIYHLLLDHHYPGHKQGLPAFFEIMQNLAKMIEDERSVTTKDTVRMLDVIVKENKPHLLKYVLNNPLIPGSKFSDPAAKKALKQGIRCGSLETAEYLISQNVQIISSHKTDEEDVNTFQDVRSLIFNILQCTHIGGGGTGHSEEIADKFWTYLAQSVYALYHPQKSNVDSNGSPKAVNESNPENEEKSEETENTMSLKYDGSDKLTIIAAKFMISNPLIVSSIYKVIHSTMTGKHYVRKLKPILHFVVEHYMKLDDAVDLETLHAECAKDEMFDSSSLKVFNIKYLHALRQEYGKTKNRRIVKMFWSEYILIKLINDYLGIEPEKLSTVKRMEQYGKFNAKLIKDEEREDILYCIRYVMSNGGAQRAKDVISPMLTGYRDQFGPSSDAEGVAAMDHVCEAVDYGNNIWRLKLMMDSEIEGLFVSVCQKEIELPLDLMTCILSFVVL